jgi:AraC family transcriptional regulator
MALGRILMQLQGRTQPLALSERASPALTSHHTSWSGLPIELHDMAPFSGPEISAGPTEGEHGLLVVLDGSIEITTRCGTRVERDVGEPGSFRILSGGTSRRVTHIRGNARVAAINVSPSWLAHIEREQRTLESGRFARDEVAHALTRAMRDEVARGAQHGRLLADALSFSLLSHVTDRYATHKQPSALACGGLSSAQRERLRQYIHAHLDSDVSLTRLSAEVGVSPRHFANLFRRAFGCSPHRYVMQLRVRAAAQRIARGERDLAQLALDLGWSSQSHFTTAFRCAAGLPPARFARLLDGRCVAASSTSQS